MSPLESQNLPHRAEAEPYYILAADLNYLKKEIEKIEERVRAAREDAALSIAQAPGDGWHDNYGYEQARRDQLAEAGRLAELKGILERVKLIAPDDAKAEHLGIGKTYRYRSKTSRRTRTVKIGGWFVAPGQPGIISYQSPLAKKLLAAINDARDKTTMMLRITKS